MEATPLQSTVNSREGEDPKASLDEGDISLIRWMLELTPTQRLEASYNFLQDVHTLRNGRKVSSKTS